MVFQDIIKLTPHGEGSSDITELISEIISGSDVSTGTCQLFVHSSQCSLLICDTADENTKSQTVDFMAQLAPDSDDATDVIDISMHTIPDDMRTALNQTSISFPVNRSKAALGIWQGIYLWEVAAKPEERKLTITVIGE